MFKKRFMGIALAVAMTMSAGAAQAVVTELAVNGGFETGDFSGWDLFPQSGTNVIAAGNASTFSGNSTLPGGPADNLIKQSNLAVGLIMPGDDITVTFDARGSLGISAVSQAILFSEFSGGGATPAFFDFGLNADPNTWTSYTWNTTAGGDVSGGVSLALKIGCGAVADCFADVFFDNVSITADIAPIPVPAAVWLFGSGLVGLVGVARRKKKAA
ncbi:MAG: VPLPA-CTERM sorting domain-containing protein [Gammaproteobacteria bacterium]|nr:VPLPA-CTERM sorting domain-containing protein [Gammaproteobacteria bacterium]NNL51593.1 VPLPA-CTERM sorting domain-containing protein [Woeseiaceae bacterium]